MTNLEIIKDRAIPILRRYGVAKAFIFGSFARGEQRENSDIDFLIEYKPEAKRSLFILLGLKEELQDVLQINVDIVTENALSPYIRNRVLQEKRVIM